MPISAATLDLFAIVLSYCAELTLFVQVLRKKLWNQLFFLFLYIIVLLPREVICTWMAHSSMLSSRGYLYFYHGSSAFFSVIRLLLIVEICWRVLRRYTSIRSLAWWFLAIVGTALFSWTIFTAVQNPHFGRALIVGTQQRSDITAAVLLLLLLVIGTYYAVHVRPLYKYVLVGSCIYSSVQVVNMEVARLTDHPSYSVFDYIQRFTFTLMIGIWAWAVWRWASVPSQDPSLISQESYDDLAPQVHDRLRELNDRLADLLNRRSR